MAAVSMAASGAAFADDGALLHFDPPQLNLAQGEHAAVDLVLDSPQQLRGFQLRIRYDPHLVALESVEAGNFFSDWANTHDSNANLVFPFRPDNARGETAVGGIALFGGPPHEGPSGSGVVLRIHLMALQDAAAGSATLDFGDVILANGDSQEVQNVMAAPAVVVVGDASAAGASSPPTYAIQAASPPSRPPDPIILGLPKSRWAEFSVPIIIGSGLILGALLYWLIMTRAGAPRRA
jgi:hypothetical protein